MLNEHLVFPDAREANPEGLLAVGGDLEPARLLLAYESGIFPWFSPHDPILWWSPDPRCVIHTDRVKVSKSMRNVLNQQRFRVTYDTAFLEVMDGCRRVERPGQDGTWITQAIMESYYELFKLGVAHSVEVWEGNTLVGGLYGVSLGDMFFGESMFAEASNASKVALIQMARDLKKEGFEWIDCQIYNDHLGRMGAELLPRDLFLDRLEQALEKDTLRGPWHFFNE
jgi:leucyl/phenylalanyl-tRNA--protein transferase